MVMDIGTKRYHKIAIVDLATHVLTFRHGENKVNKIFSWLKNWIKCSLECGKVHPFDLLPTKAELAYHLGVSPSTVQTVFRLLEDEGIVESKQRIGTYIKSVNQSLSIEKSITKRDYAIEQIKKYITEAGYKEGDLLISIRKLSKTIDISNTTTMFAIKNLVASGILKKDGDNFVVNSLDFNYELVELKTLTEKIADILRLYIKNECKRGERFPTTLELMKKYNVSSKTISDVINILSKEGLLVARRGAYGTVVADGLSNSQNTYSYKRFEQEIKKFVKQNCKIGDKIPSIRDFSSYYKTSEKTIKKALNNLAEEGYLTFVRGRYGGTFVVDIPEDSTEAYKWLALNTEYMPS